MVFTIEEDTFIVMAYFRTGIQNEDGAWQYSGEACYNQFRITYNKHEITVQAFTQHLERVIDRFLETGSVCKGKSSGRPKIITPEVVENVQEHTLRSPHKPIRQLSQQAGISYGSCRRILEKELHMKPYKISLVHELHPQDYNVFF